VFLEEERGGREEKRGIERKGKAGDGREGKGKGVSFVERTRFPEFSGCLVDFFFGNRDICISLAKRLIWKNERLWIGKCNEWMDDLKNFFFKTNKNALSPK